MLPQLRKLERKYDRRLAVVGVHAPKFIAERDTESVDRAIERLYVADSEASAMRMVQLGPDGFIRTVVGEGLFELGDQDGTGPKNVRLQHPLGVDRHQLRPNERHRAPVRATAHGAGPGRRPGMAPYPGGIPFRV